MQGTFSEEPIQDLKREPDISVVVRDIVAETAPAERPKSSIFLFGVVITMASDYTFMSTGFKDGSARPLDETFVHKLLALVYTMVKNAATTAATYAEHAKKDCVTRGDVIMALKYEARRFLHYENLEADVACSERELRDGEESDSDGWETASEHSGCEEETVPEECHCHTCDGMRHAVSTWGDWVPENEAETFIRKHVESVQHAC